jgi:hypothetical protein
LEDRRGVDSKAVQSSCAYWWASALERLCIDYLAVRCALMPRPKACEDAGLREGTRPWNKRADRRTLKGFLTHNCMTHRLYSVLTSSIPFGNSSTAARAMAPRGHLFSCWLKPGAYIGRIRKRARIEGRPPTCGGVGSINCGVLVISFSCARYDAAPTRMLGLGSTSAARR